MNMDKKHLKQYRFGAELECIIPNDNFNRFMEQKSGLPWEAGTDGSIQKGSNERGMELRCDGALTYTELTRSIIKLSKVCIDNEVHTNASCGFHLHISNKRFFNPRIIRRIVMTWAAIEDVLIATQPSSRLNNEYCRRYLLQYIRDQQTERKLPKGKDNLTAELYKDGHYNALNLGALSVHGTIEVRLHAGTTNGRKVINWTDLLVSFYEYCINRYNHTAVMELFHMNISDEKIQKTFNLLQLDVKLQEYFKTRINKFLFSLLSTQQLSASKLLKSVAVVNKAKKAEQKAAEKRRAEQNAFDHEYSNLTRTY